MADITETVAPRGVTDPDGFVSLPEISSPSTAIDDDTSSITGINNVVADGEVATSSTPAHDAADQGLFHLGETLPSTTGDLIVTADPVREAEAIADELKRGKASVLRACERLSHVWRMYNDDVSARNRLVEELVRCNVLGRSELRHGVDRSFISKMRTIGEWAPLLGRPDILSRLSEGYSVLYTAAVALDLMQGEPEDRAAELAALFATVTGGITRDFLEKEVKKRKRKRKRKPGTKSRTNSETEPATDAAAASDPEGQLDLLLITPTEEDWNQLRPDLAGLDAINRFLRTKRLSAPEAVMIFAPLREMTLVVRLLAASGFDRISHVLLTGLPLAPDVTDATVIVTAEKRPGEVIVVPEDWEPDLPDPSRARAIADTLKVSGKTIAQIFGPAGSASSSVGEEGSEESHGDA